MRCRLSQWLFESSRIPLRGYLPLPISLRQTGPRGYALLSSSLTEDPSNIAFCDGCSLLLVHSHQLDPLHFEMEVEPW